MNIFRKAYCVKTGRDRHYFFTYYEAYKWWFINSQVNNSEMLYYTRDGREWRNTWSKG